MSNQLPKKESRVTPVGKPLQRISWREKIANGYEWWKTNLDYRIGLSNFNFSTTPANKKDLRVFYDVYNNNFPLSWFDHITDPLSAQNPQHKTYPAKIRPTSMIRTNLDLLLGEYPRRPYIFQVSNMGEDGYNSFLDNLNQTLQKNVQEHFIAAAQVAMQAAGHDVPQIPQEQDIPLPEDVKTQFMGSYKDNLAVRGQKWVKRAIREYNIRQKQLLMFKDWLIVGMVRSYKNIENGNLVYDRVPPHELEFDKSPNVQFIEDGDWAVRRQLLNISDVVDMFYDELKDADHHELEMRSNWVTPFTMYNYLNGDPNSNTYNGQIPVYHVTWKGRKKIVFCNYTDPLTGQVQEMILDEDTPMDATMKITKIEWVNEVYEGYRIGDEIYCKMRPIPVQRNEMNNFSRCKLPYNGRNYSDLHSMNMGVLEMGIPYAIMYMITNFVLEKTIAKNKGKIAIFDINAIPSKDGWDEEKFLYYADALGYMMLDRNQLGVDKSWNQYTVIDMSLFDQIRHLIEIRDSFSRDWDAVLGINPQRKASISASAGDGTTQAALFQSSVMTDMIFTLFEEFTEKELQGVLDFSKFMNTEGVRGIYNIDDFDKDLLSIDPNSYCSAELGLFITHSAEEQQHLQEYKQNVQAMIQNGVKQSTILEIQKSNNLSELLEKLKEVEAIEAQQAQSSADDEHQKNIELEQIKEQFAQLENTLKIAYMNAEFDRKDELEMIKGEYMVDSMGGDGDNNNNGVPDAVEIGKRVIAQQKILAEERTKQAEIQSRERIHKSTMDVQNKQLDLEREKIKSKERIEGKKIVALKHRNKK